MKAPSAFRLARAVASAGAAAMGCQATATVKRQSAIANLQSFRVVRVRVDGSPEGKRWAGELEAAVVDRVAGSCRFDRVLPGSEPAEARPDLIVDLNIQRAYRGGTGFLNNANQAVMDVLLVLSDGGTEDLLGSAWIRGESPAVHVSGASPEGKAISAVADSVAKVLDMSGCALARIDPEPEPQPEPIAVVQPQPGDQPPPDTGPAPTPVADDSARRAEALNEEGKSLFRAANIEGATARFRAAFEARPDPRYAFNLCVSYDALKRFDEALGACQQVLDGNPSERLRGKATRRMKSIRDKR